MKLTWKAKDAENGDQFHTSRVLTCKNSVAKAVFFFQEILHEYEYEK